MFTTKQKTETDPVIIELRDYITRTLTNDQVTSVEFEKNIDQYIKLLTIESANRQGRRVSPDTLAMIGANLAGIIMILGHERANVVASKALGFVSKLR